MSFKEVYQKLGENHDISTHRELVLEAIDILAEDIAAPLGLVADEVAIQAVVAEGKSLRFLYPRVMYESGATFPVTNSSIAGSAVMMQRINFNNQASSTKHLLFFEKLNTGVRPPLPIHKMATVPVTSNGKVFGVVQLSRRAETFDEAGNDFSAEDITRIQEPLMLIGALLEDHVDGKL
jgi:hypothetical protein